MDPWEYTKRTNVCVIGGPERKERVQCRKKKIEEIMAENFPNLDKTINSQIE